MKLILILTTYLSLAFAQLLPSISLPNFDYTEYYKQQKAASEQEKLYYDSVSSKNFNYQPSLWSSPRQTIPSYLPSGSFDVPPVLGGSSYDFNQYYNSKAAASEEDQSYYAKSAVNNGNYWPMGNNYLPLDNYWPSVYPANLGGGNVYDINQYYNSKKAASEVDQGYYENAVFNGGNYWPIRNNLPKRNPNSFLPVGNAYDFSQYYNSKAAASEEDQRYYAKGAINTGNYWPISNNYLPNRYPPAPSVLPSVNHLDNYWPSVYPSSLGGGSAYDFNQYFNSKKAASEVDQSYIAKSASNNGNHWSDFNSHVPNRYPTTLLPDVKSFGNYWPSAYPSSLGGESFYDINQYYNSKKAASEEAQRFYAKSAGNYWPIGRYPSVPSVLPGGNTLDEHWSAYYPSTLGGGNVYDVNQYFNSKKAASEIDQSYYGKYGSSGNYLPSTNIAAPQVWTAPTKPFIWPSRQQYPMYNTPITGERVISENIRDRESSSANDQSSYLNNYYLSNLGASGEIASSQSSSRNRESDKSYDFSDIAKLGFGSRYRRSQH